MKTIAPIPTSMSKKNALLNLNYDVVLFNAKNSIQTSKLKSLCFYLILFFSSYFLNAQCAYSGTPLTQVGSDYTFCVDNGTTYTTGTVNSGQYVVVNVVKGFTYTFSVGNVFTANENLTILDASTNANVSPSKFASGASGATISNWVATLSGKIKILLSRGSCSNSNVTGGAITLTLNAVGNTQDSQTAYGTDQWVAHVYNWTGSPAPGGASPSTPSTTTSPFTSANYVGYYNVGTESISETFGGDYNCFPVYSNGVVRTNMYTEQFAVRYRMRSTKTGCYSLSTTGDDGVRVYVDGVKVYDEWKEQSPTSYSNILLYLNGNSDIIFDYYENGGQNVNSFSLTPFNATSNTITQNTVTVCSGVSPGLLDGSSYAYAGGAANPTISFQWQSSTDNITFTNISGATSEDYTPPTQTATTTNVVRYYRRIVTAAAATASGCSYTSNVTTVATSPGVPTTPGTISGTVTQCAAITNQIYSISAITNTTSYNWTVPTGWTITNGAGTTSITVTTGTAGQNGIISVTAVNGCGSSTAKTLAVTVNSNTVGTASSTPTLCINTALTPITHTTTGATGIGVSTGLPFGVTASWASNTITISGTPTASGTFSYSIPLIGGCGTANATGSITVTPNKTVSIASSAPTLCINTALTSITHTTTGATGIGAATGLPSGVTASWVSNTITISGTPTASGTFSYSIPLIGGCGTVSATGTITVTPNKTVSTASSTPTLCINTALTSITHTTTTATGIGAATGLPSGVTASWALNTITVSGTPTASGTFNYSIPLIGGCGTANASGTITVIPANTVSAASSTPTLCINTALTAITHTSTRATGIGTAIGLPSGVTASWASNIITISGTPTVPGTFNYSIPLTGGCGTVSATGTITVTQNKTVSIASSTPTLCINTVLTSISHITTGATGIGVATGLPSGVTASWASNTITISGTPTVSGTFSYSIPLTGGCGTVSATGMITVTPNKTVSTASSTPTLCINTALTSITHTTTGTIGIGVATGLPSGVTASWASNTITISGTPTASGTFNYSIPLNGCGTANATGRITVTPANTVSAASSTPTLCINTALTAITHTTTRATGIGTATGLPSGVTASWASNTITISGTPTASGTFNYSIPLTGGCGPVSATGTIIVNPIASASVSITSTATSICLGTSVTFTATPTNGGVSPSYQWKVNNNNVGTNSNVFTTSALNNNDIVKVVMTSSISSCISTITATSNNVVIAINSLPTASVLSNNGPSICSGSNAVFTVSGTLGSTITYNLNGGSNTTATLTAGIATITVNGATSAQMLNLVSVSNGTCSASIGTSSSVTLETTIWNGSIWDNGLPNSSKAVVFTGDYTMTSDFSACSISVLNNAVVSVDSGKNVSLNGAITVASGSSFILNTNANLYQSDASAVNTGNVIVKRDSNPLIRLDYTMWSSPVAGQKLLAFSPLTSIAPTIRFYTYNSTTNSYNSVASPSTTDFATGKGYLIRLPYNHPTAPAVWNGAFTGVPNNGTKTVALTNVDETHQYNAVGNPYPSPISVSQFLLDNISNIEPTIYFWRKTNNATKPSYCTWNCASQTFISNGEAFSANPNGVIQTGQGFIVEAKGSATSLVFNNGQRVVNNTNHFFKTNSSSATTSIESHRIWLNLTGAATEYSQAVVGYFTNAIQGADDYDSKLFNDGSITLSTKIGADDYVIQSRPTPFDTADIVPLNYKVTTAGTYTFTIDHVDGLFTAGAQEVYIKDNLDGSYHNITTTPYSFVSAAGTFSNRFELVYQNLLSSNETSFTANSIVVYHQQNDVVINTGSATMSNVKVYDIRGRLLVEKKDVNASETRINVGTTNQVVLVQVTTNEGLKATKKVVN